MHRPDPTPFAEKLRGLEDGVPKLAESLKGMVEVLLEMEDETDVEAMKGLEKMYGDHASNYDLSSRICRVADLSGASAMRIYALDAIEYQTDLLERIVQLMEASSATPDE